MAAMQKIQQTSGERVENKLGRGICLHFSMQSVAYTFQQIKYCLPNAAGTKISWVHFIRYDTLK